MLSIAGELLNPRLVVFDKDGTLVAFGDMWRKWFDAMIEAIASQISMNEAMWQGVAATLGIDHETREWDPLGPLTLASTSEVVLLLASQVYRYADATWDAALELVGEAQRRTRAALATLDLVRPIGDVQSTLQRLYNHGFLLAVATTDDREPALAGLEKLGIASVFAEIVCGDDGIRPKPAPDMALAICERLGVPPEQAIMVGDTTADLMMARRAGYCCAIAVTSGAQPRELLAPHADLVIPDIHAIQVAAPAKSTP